MKHGNKQDWIRRLFCALLAGLLAGGMLMGMIGCGREETETTGGDTTASETTVNTEETELMPDVPITDMEGKDMHLFIQGWCNYDPLQIKDILVEEINGEGINDAAYNRNLEMEQLFNCTLSAEVEPNSYDDGINHVINTVTAGDAAYDFVLMRAIQYNRLCLSGGFYMLSDVPHIDLTKPWWDSGFYDAVSILGKTYGAISDITINSYLLAADVYFNKDMIQDYGLDDPYTLVNEGKWTWDKMFEMADVVDQDLNGDGNYTNEDLFGITYIDDSPEALLTAANVTFAELDKDGIPQVTLYSENNMTKIMHLSDLLQDQAISFNCHARSPQANADEAGMLVRGATLFCLGGLYYAPEMRMMDQEFGIVPYPKYDDEQNEYRIPMVTVALTYASVPLTNTDLDNTGIFMEYYAYLGRRDIVPALYEKLLLGKVSRDNESQAMLDIIFNNRFFDTGMIFDFGGLRTDLRTQYHNLKEDFSSLFATNKTKVAENIEDVVEQFRALED